MTRIEHLMICLMEECAEVSQRASKSLRFGVNEIQPGQAETNAQRLAGEMVDLMTVYSMLVKDGVLPSLGILTGESAAASRAKRDKVEKFLLYSAECGTLTPDEENR
jgi:hypothetical protein